MDILYNNSDIKKLVIEDIKNRFQLESEMILFDDIISLYDGYGDNAFIGEKSRFEEYKK
jgi:hypothetical protein